MVYKKTYTKLVNKYGKRKSTKWGANGEYINAFMLLRHKFKNIKIYILSSTSINMNMNMNISS